MAPANKKKQIPFFSCISFLLKVEFRAPHEWGPDLRKLREDTGRTEKYVCIAWYSDHTSNLQATNGKEEAGKRRNFKGATVRPELCPVPHGTSPKLAGRVFRGIFS